MPTPTLSAQMASQAAKIIDNIPHHGIFQDVFVHPVINALVAVYKLIDGIGIPYALGFSIIAIVLLIRKLLDPLYVRQIELSKKMQDVKPELEAIQKEYKADQQTLQLKTMELYKKHNINPAAGCLPIIVQLPIVYALYQALQAITVPDVTGKLVENINSILVHPALHLSALKTDFFGLNLGTSPSQHGVASVYMLIPLITAYLQWYQFDLSLKSQNGGKKDTQPTLKGTDAQEAKLSPSQEDFTQTFNKQMKFLLPGMIGYFSWQFPVGLSLYWNIITLYSILNYRNLNKKATELFIEDKAAEEAQEKATRTTPKAIAQKSKKHTH